MKKYFYTYEECEPYLGKVFWHLHWECMVEVIQVQQFYEGWVLLAKGKGELFNLNCYPEHLIEPSEMVEVLYD